MKVCASVCNIGEFSQYKVGIIADNDTAAITVATLYCASAAVTRVEFLI